MTTPSTELRGVARRACRRAPTSQRVADGSFRGLKDRSREAEFVLGGTVRDLRCVNRRGHTNCRIGIEWELLDVKRDAVVYRVMTRYRALGVSRTNPASVGKRLVLGSLRSLASRKRFLAYVNRRASQRSQRRKRRSYAPATFQRCNAGPRPMPAAAEDVLKATVLVQSGDAFGSGFFLTSDGLVLTARHVVSTRNVKLLTRDGRELSARPIRIAQSVDVALLQVRGALSAPTPCLGLASKPMSTASEVYAIGSPASKQLAFSFSRGIISGTRTIEGVQYLQTDASISPGNSGGPLIDSSGRATAIVSWKLAGVSVEGVAFGIPIHAGLDGLRLTPGSQTDDALKSASTIPLAHAPVRTKVFEDDPDPVPSLDPEGERARARAEWAAPQADLDEEDDGERDEATPGYVSVLRWGGFGVGVVGLVTAIQSYAEYDEEETTPADFAALRTRNDVGWVLAGVGTAVFTASFFLVPSSPDEEAAGSAGRAQAAVGVTLPGTMHLGVRF